jgi:hypothetical protein
MDNPILFAVPIGILLLLALWAKLIEKFPVLLKFSQRKWIDRTISILVWLVIGMFVIIAFSTSSPGDSEYRATWGDF